MSIKKKTVDFDDLSGYHESLVKGELTMVAIMLDNDTLKKLADKADKDGGSVADEISKAINIHLDTNKTESQKPKKRLLTERM
jgi:hypothetical protein